MSITTDKIISSESAQRAHRHRQCRLMASLNKRIREGERMFAVSRNDFTIGCAPMVEKQLIAAGWKVKVYHRDSQNFWTIVFQAKNEKFIL